MKKAYLIREYKPSVTIGRLLSFNSKMDSVLDIRTIELPWLKNARNISCYPPGEYEVFARYKRTVYNDIQWRNVQDDINRNVPKPKSYPSILYYTNVTDEYMWVKGTTSQNFGWHYHVQDVPNRGGILFHPANYVSQLRGCTAPGNYHSDINRDGVIDVSDSRKALGKMLEALGDRFKLYVT